MNKNYEIKRKEIHGEFYEKIEYTAVKNNKEIFGASADITRSIRFESINRNWSIWKINYGTCGSMDYKTALPYIDVINTAMKELKKLNKRRLT